jgi:hypothetical protein
VDDFRIYFTKLIIDEIIHWIRSLIKVYDLTLGIDLGLSEYSDCTISPLYQGIRDAENNMFSFGDPTGIYPKSTSHFVMARISNIQISIVKSHKKIPHFGEIFFV